MASLLQFVLLLVCWLGALAALLIFVENSFAFSGRKRFIERRASGAYGVISVFVPMRGSPAAVERAVRSIFNQSYPFIELFLIHFEEDGRFAQLAREFRAARSHIPVRVVRVPFRLESPHERTRALEQAHADARGRWFAVLDPEVALERLAVETALEFAGSNEIPALALSAGVRCVRPLQQVIAPSMEQLLQIMRIANRRERRKSLDLETPFLLLYREAFETVSRNNRMPGILNEAGWNIWGYQLENLQTFEGDGSRWMWREADVRSWSSDTDPERPHGRMSTSLVIGSAILPLVAVTGLAFGLTQRIDNFTGAGILAFSAVTYVLMSIGYFLFARRFRAAAWFAPLWFISHIPAALLTLVEIRRGHQASSLTPRKRSASLTRS